jgi:hypothetical protein
MEHHKYGDDPHELELRAKAASRYMGNAWIVSLLVAVVATAALILTKV